MGDFVVRGQQTHKLCPVRFRNCFVLTRYATNPHEVHTESERCNNLHVGLAAVRKVPVLMQSLVSSVDVSCLDAGCLFFQIVVVGPRGCRNNEW